MAVDADRKLTRWVNIQSARTAIPFIRSIKEHPKFSRDELPADVENALIASTYIGESVAFTLETVKRTTHR